ncbi:centrosome-associated protein CEP250 [Passer montanus]|uniref:centrosome-associated protein CEP250 n=1 Tax=Passer montanus TaxID=9160 RepID=UPI00195F9091|nr:centrosome-associated protein CEP250 [Passer montanus]
MAGSSSHRELSPASLRRRLRSAEEAQQRQAGLVRQLQDEVLQYQTWCQELEQQVKAAGGSLPGRWEATADHSLEKALLQVEEEQQRCENLAEVNTLLREHLNKASEVNSALKEDVGKLTVDWMRAREELELKESEWRTKQELYDSYLRGEHSRLLSLWRQVVTFRRHFLEMKTATDRDLSELKAEQMRLSGSIIVNCSRLNSCVHLRESIPVGKPALKDQAEQQVEPKINQTAQEVIALQVRCDMEKKELQDRVMELSALLVQSQKQNEEKEKTMKTLNDTVEILESSWIEKEFAASLSNSAKEENLFLQKLIKNITEMVLDDSDSMVSIICTGSSQHANSGDIFSAPRSVDAGHAFGLVLEALARMRGAARALREELSARQDSNKFLLQQQRHQEEKCREVQQRLEQLEEKCKKSSSHQQHLQSLVETLRSDCANLEKTRKELQEQLGLREQEASCLRQSNAELQMKEESAQAEKAEQQDRMERACREQELLVKDLAALEEKHSLLQSELVVKRQTLEKLQLQKDLLEQEKDEFAMALEKAQRSVAELTGAQNKLNAERADLQAAAEKMSSINESLALDKVQLNKYVWQLEQEKEVLSAKVDEMEREKICEQEKLNFFERANKELCAEKARLEQLLKEAEEQREELWLELSTLGEEKAETQEKFHQVSQEQESLSRALEQLRQESSDQGHELAQACREKELLGREKAALEGRLAATERHQQDLSRQLAETRSAKESLESRLFAAQQQISQLEISRNHLEAQVFIVTQAKEVIEGEVKCLQGELEAERALRKQEQEDTAQQLLQAQQQHHESLRLQGTAQQVEIKKLLEDLAFKPSERVFLKSKPPLPEFPKKDVVRDHVKSLTEVKVNNIHCSTFVHPGAALSLRLCASIFQIRALQDAVLQMEASQATREKQLLKELEESRAGERCLRDSVHVLEAEVSELRVKLQSSENRAEALATQCQEASGAHQETQSQLDKLLLVLHHMIRDSRELVTWSSEEGHVMGLIAPQAGDVPTELTVDRVAAALQDLQQHLEHSQKDLNDARKKIQTLELELGTAQDQMENLRASNQELQIQLEESQAAMLRAEHQKTSLETALKEEAIALKEEAVTLHQEVESLQRKLENLEKERKDVLPSADPHQLQADKEKLEHEIKLLEESVTVSEMQANTAIDKNHSLEQELQTALSMLKIKNEEVQNQGKKMEILQKEAAETKALQEQLTRVTAILSEREGEMKLYQEQMRMLEKQKEMHKTALNQVIKDITEKEQKTESQQEQIQELEKQQEKQRIVFNKMSQELEEKDHEIRSQQELIRELEKQLELQNSTVSRVSKELEERHLEIKFQEEKIMILEQHGAVQVRNLLVDLDDMKGNLKEKRLELLSLTQQIQELEKEREDVKSLNASLEHLKTVLKDRESECDAQREELRLLQQHKEQQDRHLQELLGKVEIMTLSLSKKDQELESQQKQMQEVEEVMEMQLKTTRDQLEQTLATLKEKDRLMDIQKQQTRSYEEKKEEQINVLHRDLEYSRTVLKEKDLMIESQKELIETFQKQKQDSEQQKQILQCLQMELKEKEEEIFSLRKQCEAFKEKEEKHEAEQRNFHATTLTLKEKEDKICVLEDAITKFQQQKEETAVQTKAILQKLEHAESSLEARDQEIVSLQEHVQDLREQKEVAGKQVRSLEQDLDKANQILNKNHLEFLKQTEQMNTFQLREESMKVALTSCQKQVTLLEEVVRKKDEDNDALRQKLQHAEEELKTLQNLQLRLTEKNEEVRHDGEQEFLKEAFPEREGEIKAQSERKQLEVEIRALQENLQHVQQTLTKKDKEIKYQTDRVKYLKKTLIEREQELRRQSELLKELTLALRWKDEGETLKIQIQKLQKWEEEEVEKILQERDHLLQRQKKITQQLEAEREANGEELECVAAALKQRESREREWRENAQVLSAALSKSEMANGNLKKEITILQRMISERDTDRFHQQQAVAEGEQLSWLSEKRLMLQSLECLQRAVAKLEDEKVELRQQNTELRRTLEQVEHERRRLKRCFRGRLLPDASGISLSESDQCKLPASRQEESHAHCSQRLAELQNQVSLLQSQLAQDREHRQNYIESCARTSQELSNLHQELSCSFAAVLKEPKAAVLEEETRKLDRSLNLNSALTSLSHQSLERQPEHPRARPARSNDDLR